MPSEQEEMPDPNRIEVEFGDVVEGFKSQIASQSEAIAQNGAVIKKLSRTVQDQQEIIQSLQAQIDEYASIINRRDTHVE